MTHATSPGTTAIRTRLLPALVVGLVALAAAWVALLPGLAFWDTGELQAVAPLMGTAHPTGFPTYVLLGWLASVLLQPFGRAGVPDEPVLGDLPRAWRPASPSTSSAS